VSITPLLPRDAVETDMPGFQTKDCLSRPHRHDDFQPFFSSAAKVSWTVFLTACCTAVLSCNLLKPTFLPDCPADLAPAVLGVAGVPDFFGHRSARSRCPSCPQVKQPVLPAAVALASVELELVDLVPCLVALN
jgi:hypothetical protein